MESFLHTGHGRLPTTAAPLLVLIVECDRLGLPWDTREVIARHLGVSKDGIDRAIRNAIDRKLITETVDRLRRDDPKRPQDKHVLARRRYVPSRMLRTVVDEALQAKRAKQSTPASEMRAEA